ncbi:hypothetical protein B0T24DRAFT_643197 [Lasiosphaeria ovina]|uniref:Uncharacterized protein n=1 Tax=Lasiosphaeria ovina TaxID=92902 RepID=A0AAE0MXV1_9PEZI|nr:hypothetical protein B0T24DRAFT_643197 [Lasiosphaeria ovina]
MGIKYFPKLPGVVVDAWTGYAALGCRNELRDSKSQGYISKLQHHGKAVISSSTQTAKHTDSNPPQPSPWSPSATRRPRRWPRWLSSSATFRRATTSRCRASSRPTRRGSPWARPSSPATWAARCRRRRTWRRCPTRASSTTTRSTSRTRSSRATRPTSRCASSATSATCTGSTTPRTPSTSTPTSRSPCSTSTRTASPSTGWCSI